MNTSYDVVCFGEVLWDILEDKKMAGGAPMNVAYHINRQGFSAAMISALGADVNGKELLDQFRKLSIPVNFIQEKKDQATSTVIATRKTAEEMAYDIVHPVAWDGINYDSSLAAAVQTTRFFVFGSLVARDAISRSTLLQLLAASKAVNVLDLNLRKPHYTWEVLTTLLTYTHILKLNEEEFDYLVQQLQLPATDWKEHVKLIAEQYHLQIIVITRGANGVVVYQHGNIYEHPGFKVKVADTIGSGDAFLAGFLIGMLQEKTIAATIYFASQMGAYIASRAGACPSYQVADVLRIQ